MNEDGPSNNFFQVEQLASQGEASSGTAYTTVHRVLDQLGFLATFHQISNILMIIYLDGVFLTQALSPRLKNTAGSGGELCKAIPSTN